MDEIVRIRQEILRSDTENFLQLWIFWFEKLENFLFAKSTGPNGKRLTAAVLEEFLMEISKIPKIFRDFSTSRLILLIEKFVENFEIFGFKNFEIFECLKTCIILFPGAAAQRSNILAEFFIKIFCEKNFLFDVAVDCMAVLSTVAPVHGPVPSRAHGPVPRRAQGPEKSLEVAAQGPGSSRAQGPEKNFESAAQGSRSSRAQGPEKYAENWQKNFEIALGTGHAIFGKFFASKCSELSDRIRTDRLDVKSATTNAINSANESNSGSTDAINTINEANAWLAVATRMLELPLKHPVRIRIL